MGLVPIQLSSALTGISGPVTYSLKKFLLVMFFIKTGKRYLVVLCYVRYMIFPHQGLKMVAVPSALIESIVKVAFCTGLPKMHGRIILITVVG